MIAALYLFFVQGVLGAFDTIYYHEWRARLTGGVPGTTPELRLHALRDFIYAVLFATLPFFRYRGQYAWWLAALLLAEITITLRDFVVEQKVRQPLGGVYSGERVTHAIMGILFGAALANLVPELLHDQDLETALVPWDSPSPLRYVMLVMAGGVFLSGVRDLSATYGVKWAQYPWSAAETSPTARALRHSEAAGLRRNLERARKNPGPYRKR